MARRRRPVTYRVSYMTTVGDGLPMESFVRHVTVAYIDLSGGEREQNRSVAGCAEGTSVVYNGSVDGMTSVVYNGSVDGMTSVVYNGSVDGMTSVVYNGGVDGMASVVYNGSVDGADSVVYTVIPNHEISDDNHKTSAMYCYNDGRSVFELGRWNMNLTPSDYTSCEDFPRDENLASAKLFHCSDGVIKSGKYHYNVANLTSDISAHQHVGYTESDVCLCVDDASIKGTGSSSDIQHYNDDWTVPHIHNNMHRNVSSRTNFTNKQIHIMTSREDKEHVSYPENITGIVWHNDVIDEIGRVEFKQAPCSDGELITGSVSQQYDSSKDSSPDPCDGELTSLTSETESDQFGLAQKVVSDSGFQEMYSSRWDLLKDSFTTDGVYLSSNEDSLRSSLGGPTASEEAEPLVLEENGQRSVYWTLSDGCGCDLDKNQSGHSDLTVISPTSDVLFQDWHLVIDNNTRYCDQDQHNVICDQQPSKCSQMERQFIKNTNKDSVRYSALKFHASSIDSLPAAHDNFEVSSSNYLISQAPADDMDWDESFKDVSQPLYPEGRDWLGKHVTSSEISPRVVSPNNNLMCSTIGQHCLEAGQYVLKNRWCKTWPSSHRVSLEPIFKDKSPKFDEKLFKTERFLYLRPYGIRVYGAEVDSATSGSSRFEVNYGKFYNTSYLEKTSASYKKGPSLNVSHKPRSPHYHRPENFSYTQVRKDFIQPLKKGELKVGFGRLVDLLL
ncbi:hypothetical protein LSH36_496g02038 [Paralvinella palmiformis]|uniref:Uncharacterized protein n=1 Tax=Paralvinella palmiformis TaxID=53620 RepID=A0AAD9J930_9ANNE|nr:hypothetical protein LSH36_496g02038 [Paralvinella palmiformis]